MADRDEDSELDKMLRIERATRNVPWRLVNNWAVYAENMHRECVRDGWIMGEHPVRFLRGNDHE